MRKISVILICLACVWRERPVQASTATLQQSNAVGGSQHPLQVLQATSPHRLPRERKLKNGQVSAGDIINPLKVLALLLLELDTATAFNEPGLGARLLNGSPASQERAVSYANSPCSAGRESSAVFLDDQSQRSRGEVRMGPPLPPAQNGFSLSAPGKPVVVEMFLDFVCPFSCKMFKTVQDGVLPKFGEKVSFVVHQVVQPWHAQGTWVHEVCLAVAAEFPSQYAEYVRKVIEAYEGGDFQDESTWDQSRGQVYEDLFKIADGVGGIEVSKLRDMVKLAGTGNAGNQVTQSIKWACKLHRTRGVHVTPTVFVNGLEAGIVSSGWTADEWSKFLEPMGADFFQGSKL